MKETQKLAHYVNEITYDKLPKDVIQKAKECLLDYLGVCFYSSEMVWSKILIDFVESFGSKMESTVISRSTKTSSPYAALANGTMGHGFELDDVDETSLTHPGAVVIPSALAIGEKQRISGKILITSIVIGYEVMARIGGAMATSHILRGFHPTGTNGTFASAAAAGKILQLTDDQIINSFGIAGSFSSGLMEFSQSSGMVKRVHAGQAAANGIVAAMLAQKGLTGPPTILEGKYGYFNAFSDEYDLRYVIREINGDYLIRHVSLKPYACCRLLHSAIDAITALKEEHSIVIDSIEKVEVGGSEKLINQHMIYNPKSMMEAQYSLPFVSALTVLGIIDDPRRFNESALNDQKILRISRRVTAFKDHTIDELFPKKCSAKVIVTLNDGRSYEKVVMDAKGHEQNPLTKDEVISKFRGLSKDVISDRQMSRIIERVDNLEKIDNISLLSDLLRGV